MNIVFVIHIINITKQQMTVQAQSVDEWTMTQAYTHSSVGPELFNELLPPLVRMFPIMIWGYLH